MAPDENFGYGWLLAGDRPGAWMSEAACFTFLDGMRAEDVVASDRLENVERIDLSGDPDAAEHFLDPDDRADTAVFETGTGWTVVYQTNATRYHLAEALFTSRSVNRGVFVFWNVNSVVEFAYWENGHEVTAFEWSDERGGSHPDRFNENLRAVGLNTGPAAEDDEPNIQPSQVQLLALAERVTGVHLDADFLARPLFAARNVD
jgi:hypothetical protein